MRTVNRSSLVAYSAEQMFDLVNDIEAYPEFLPWCTDARIGEQSANGMTATIELRKGPLRKQFTTRNTLDRPESIELALVGGPFRQLGGRWRFEQLGEEGSKVSLNLEFEFDSAFVEMMLGSFFEETCNSLVDAFARRAEQVYGIR